MKLEEAIHQAKFDRESNKAAINLLYTASWFRTQTARVLKPYGISGQQFNIMRILRGQKERPVLLKLISERMIDKMSNTSRLVDKLVDKSLIRREVCPKDRRKVDILITKEGAKLLKMASVAMDLHVDRTLGHLTKPELTEMNRILDKIRNI